MRAVRRTREALIAARSSRAGERAGPGRVPVRPMMSDALEQLVEVERGTSAEVFVVGSEECVTGAAPLIAQHAQKFPLGIELRRIAELDHHVARDAMNAHVGPFRVFGIVRLCD